MKPCRLGLKAGGRLWCEQDDDLQPCPCGKLYSVVEAGARRGGEWSDVSHEKSDVREGEKRRTRKAAAGCQRVGCQKR